MTLEHRVLAQKYRSSCLKEIIGQEILVKTLTNAIQNNQLPHAFVFTGIRGTGKTSTARIIALSLNCLDKPKDALGTLTPCLKCAACTAIQEGHHIDVIEMDAASHTGVDDIREIIEASKYRPLQATYKIYIIDEVHMLSKSAFNALLKTLEEPPAHVKFILATTEIRKIPATVLSRCMRFDLQRVSSSVLKEHYQKIMAKENVAIDDSALQLIAEMAEGSVRDGLSLLEQAIHLNSNSVDENAVRLMLGRANKQSIEQLFDLLLQGKVSQALTHVRQLYGQGIEADSLLQSLLECVHRTSLYKIESLPSTQSLLTTIAAKVSLATLTRFWQIVLKGLEEVKQSPFALMAVEMIIIRLSYVKDLPPLDSIMLNNLSNNNQNSTIVSAAVGVNTIKPPISLSTAPAELIDTACAPQIAPLVKYSNSSSPKLAPTTMLESFEDLVKFVATAREPLLYTHLIQDVQMVSYTLGHLVINVAPDVSPHFSKDLKKLLDTFTKINWVIDLSSQQGKSCFKDQQKIIHQQEIDQYAQHSFVRETLNLFSNSTIDKILIEKPLSEITV